MKKTLVTVAATLLVVAGCGGGDRPSSDELFDAMTQGQVSGDEETFVRCLADAMADDDRISDETLQEIVDGDYGDNPSDFPDGENDALEEIFIDCAELDIEG